MQTFIFNHKKRRRKRDSLGTNAGPRGISDITFTFSDRCNFFHSLKSFPQWDVMGHRLRLNRITSSVYLLLHSLFSSSSIHPDYTSNGSSSQQPPTVMELCLNEQPHLPFFLLLGLFPLSTHTHILTSFLFHFTEGTQHQWSIVKR